MSYLCAQQALKGRNVQISTHLFYSLQKSSSKPCKTSLDHLIQNGVGESTQFPFRSPTGLGSSDRICAASKNKPNFSRRTLGWQSPMACSQAQGCSQCVDGRSSVKGKLDPLRFRMDFIILLMINNNNRSASALGFLKCRPEGKKLQRTKLLSLIWIHQII